MKLFASKSLTLFALFFFCVSFASFGAEPGRKILHGHVPRVVAHLTAKGRLAMTNQLTLAIGLPLHNQTELDELLRQIYDPSSTNYHKYLTPEKFTARFGPTEADYEAVKNFARTNDLTITGTFANRMVLDVAGRVPAIEKAFHITLRTYRHPTENRDFFAPDTEPTVNVSLPIIDVSGLDNYSPPKPNLRRLPTTATPRIGSSPNGTYMGNDFRAAYVPGTTLDGSGQMVGLLQFDGFYSNDIVAYENQTGRTNIPVQTILLDNVSGVPGYLGIANGNIETSLDIEMAISMAPALAHVFVFEGNNQNDILNAMASSNLVKNLSSSWGWGGGPSTTTDNIFKIMAAQGQSYFNATGDSDAFASGTADINAPSTSPYITQVGGTTLSTSSAGGNYASETVWNRGNGVGSSGGISTYYSIPVWQQGVNSFASNGGSATTRNVPDLALVAENVYVLYGNNSPAGSVGGTSCAAPLWAGLMALINQQAAANGQPSVGFINPAIYELANESIYASVFHDTTAGDNTWSSSPNSFYATPGYDLCTGLGTPNGTNLINALLNPDPLIVISNHGFNAVGSAAGIFNLTTQTFNLTNVGNAPLSWSLVNTSAWLNVSSTGGTLIPGAGDSVVVSLNAVATNLAAGSYSAIMGFANNTSGITHFRSFTLNVSDPLVILPTTFSLVGPVGGSLISQTQQIILTNAKADALNWSLLNNSDLFTVSPVSGTLAGGAATNIIFSLTPTATNLPAGIYTAAFQVTNLSSEFVQMVTGNVVIGQALVQNGDFETGDFTGWILDGDGYNANYVDGSDSYVTPHSGNYCALLGEPLVLAYLSQTLLTTAGQKYLISLWLNNPAHYTPNEFFVSWNGSTLYDKKNLSPINWTQLQFVVTASDGNSVLKIGGRDDNYYLGLDDVKVTPGFAPQITTQPADAAVLAGSPAIFNATVTGSTNLIFQWRKNGVNLANGAGISGTTSNVLMFAATTAANAGNYSFVVTNIFGVATSSVAALTIWLPPAITSSSLTNRTIQCSSNNIILTVNLSGTPPLNLQWSLDGTPVANATNTTFSLTNISRPDHLVTIAVTNLYGQLASNAVLIVQDTLAPMITLNGSNPLILELGETFADPGASATDICAGNLPVTITGFVNTNAVGTNTLSYAANDGGGNSTAVTRSVIVRDGTPPEIVWSFTNLVVAADTNCSAPMPDVTGTNFILATDLSAPLTIIQSPTNNTLLSVGTNFVVIAVADAFGNFAYATNAIVVADQTPPVILTQPQNLTNDAGTTANFDVTASACSPQTFQWFFNNGMLDGQTSDLLTLTNVNLATGGNYFAVVTSSGGASTSAVATLTVDLQPSTLTLNSTANPSGFNDALFFTAAVTPMSASGNIQFFTNGAAFDLISLAAGQAVSTNLALLPRGTNFITAIFAGDVNDSPATNFLLQIVTNHPPVAVTAFYTNGTDFTLTIPLVSLAKDWSDVDGDSLSLAEISPSTNGIILTNAGAMLLYYNRNRVADQFTCTITDGFGGTNYQLVNIVAAPPPAPAPSIVNVAGQNDGSVTLSLVGASGYTYILETTSSLFPFTDWQPIATNMLGTNNVWQFNDAQATNFSQRFYRLKLAW